MTAISTLSRTTITKKIKTYCNQLIVRIQNALKSTPERTLLLVLSIAVGLLSGLAAVVLKYAIELIQRWLSAGFADHGYNWFYLVTPGVGMLLSLLLVKFVVKDNIGHGVTRVLRAISRNEARILKHNTWSSVVTSSVTIGFGGSVGAEAPIVYTGAAIGSNVAKLLGLSYKQMTIMLGCGAAGAVAGIFKAPIAGVLFTLEILMFNISVTSILPLLFSSVTATMVSYLFLGKDVVFPNAVDSFALSNIPYYIILGIACGFISLYFLRTTLRVEDKLKRFRNPYTKWSVCAVLLGIMIFLFPQLYGEGYNSLLPMLNNEPIGSVGMFLPDRLASDRWIIILFFTAVMLAKVYATAFTNGGGGVGGTFGPTLFTGAIAGFVLVRLLEILGVDTLPEANFVLVGMAGLMAGVMQAPLTAIFLIAEISGGYVLMFPLMIVSAISFATIRMFEQYSIYTKRIAASGELLTHDSDQAVLTLLKISDFIETDFSPVGIDKKLGDLVEIISSSNRNIIPVVDEEGIYQGLVFVDDVRNIMFNRDLYDKVTIKEIVKDSPSVLSSKEKMESVMNKFESTEAWNLPVLDEQGRYLGFVSKSQIFTSYREQLHQVSHD